MLTVALLLASFGVPATGVAAPDPGSATVPCPSVPATRPPRPTPPRVDPVSRTVGGTGLATPGLVAPAGATRPPAVSATSWLVADLDTGAVLGGCGPHEYATPASVQKLLLAATMLPRLDPGQLVTATHGDVDIEPGSSAMGLVEGGHYPLESVWLGLLLTSGNDAANLLARLGGGPDGLPGGVRAMNEQARRLGALQTHAVTPSGLDGPGQFTSAYDLALIARACFADARFRRYELTERARVPAQPALRRKGYEIQNDNQLIQRYPGALGGKTGFTDLARHTYVGAAERGGRRLVVTLLGAEVDRQRGWQQGATLLDWGFALPRDASVGRLVAPGETLTPSPTTGATLPVVDTGRAATHSDGLARVGRWWTLLVVAVGLVGTGLLTSLFSRRRRPLRATGGDADPG
ncbi:D-alanyl-D-alanine carboxypeptidase [Micromonospora yangpuensis]|uniref:D-alanyl-D-alanine carboxypeptidase (Penicillin-binding protein 5/6) n=1 Tax=Micromonospora yangpuensis TaxID=683228 RepID=A0A1C6UV60_9ACTN|nr:serine hydrolase [Micromonospora yangpuensis]GGM24030.1 D-alanyl-D-alanine carboxypeptidase [Micromonospora yangpuensis]SCL57699.1 D-alanyl-D-alanine carboxypeptidase (penicillin-binding protein 5/6) [Micromonospora yangpuensis]